MSVQAPGSGLLSPTCIMYLIISTKLPGNDIQNQNPRKAEEKRTIEKRTQQTQPYLMAVYSTGICLDINEKNRRNECLLEV